MTTSNVRVALDEIERITECAIEPIHIPGAIQPHGALVVIDASTFAIQQVSANTLEMFGVEPVTLLGHPVEQLLSRESIADALDTDDEVIANPFVVDMRGRSFDLIVHRSGETIILEFEPVLDEDARLLPALNAAMRRLSASRTVETLRATAVREIRALIHFDRAMLYHFYPDGHGEIVAEDRVPELEPYLHQHFPASDIPAQARALYLTKASQLIASSDYQPVALEPAINPGSGQPIDLSGAELRSVSPHHLRYMRNMGTAASLSFSLVREGELIGMITCHSIEPRVVSYVQRRACEILAEQVTLQLGALAQREHLEREHAYQQVRSELVEQIEASGDIGAGLCLGRVTLLDLVHADGAVARVGGVMLKLGTTPADAEIRELARTIANSDNPTVVTSGALAFDHPDLAAVVPSVAGLVYWPSGPGGDFVAWFRREVLQTIDWLGDQTELNRDTPFSPRNSFSLWQESVEGTSEAWSPDDIDQIAELIRDLDGIRADQAADSDLNRAGAVQRALQPSTAAPFVGYEVAGDCLPTRTVGGDFYDWYSVEDGFVITLGDVMGKGVGAGMIAATVRASLRADRQSRDSSVAVTRASAMLDADLSDAATFVTLFHARLAALTGEVSYTDAGHGLSLIVRSDGSSVRLSGGDLPLGLVADSSYSSHVVVLNPGDMLVSVSDGVLDIYDGSLDALERVADLARTATSPQALVDSIMTLAGGMSMPDDVTAVAVRRNAANS